MECGDSIVLAEPGGGAAMRTGEFDPPQAEE